MLEFVPYFAGFVSITFGIAFYFGIQELRDATETDKKNESNID